MTNRLPAPHGGCGLINRTLPEIEKQTVLNEIKDLNIYKISDADLSIFYRIADGALSPLEGPMDSAEFKRVLEEEVIERNGQKYAWTIPIAFPIAQAEADRLKTGEIVAVQNEQGLPAVSLWQA
ncbi:MAG: sulfate adenylyltransferase, partial [Candidatus Marinimicrobia bacterium]|nr:sulfate adenylyltransferase [Candidatus Neomarinimicrobiota bacterium]